ncbi:TraR/DksA family transcriptional regulator [Streptomyces radicis]
MTALLVPINAFRSPQCTGRSRGASTGYGGGRAGHKAGRPARPRCRAQPVDLSFRSRFASKITLCEGADAMVAAKKGTAGEPVPPVPSVRAAAPAVPGELAVRSGEEPWTEAEVAEARDQLTIEADRLRGEIRSVEEALTGLMRDSGDGAGDDQADTGTKNVTREHEMALASNAREMLYQTERALQRLEAGTYGLCESCGNPIGKARMQVFPRATLCVDCKQKQERRF